jgi:cytidyltransferase-like protein
MVGYVSGAFDLLHVGHIRFLQKCKQHCDQLIVGVLSDAYIESYKRKPIIPFEQRLELISSLAMVNLAIPGQPTNTLTPEFYQQYNINYQFVGREHLNIDMFARARELGYLKIIDNDSHVHTTDIISRILERHGYK